MAAIANCCRPYSARLSGVQRRNNSLRYCATFHATRLHKVRPAVGLGLLGISAFAHKRELGWSAAAVACIAGP